MGRRTRRVARLRRSEPSVSQRRETSGREYPVVEELGVSG
ncbi:MAG: hypothetical protein OZSIB_1998 [Candidatus Ozemobacter sibiricus]|uniref:Uncharacterized protein n=1 Tax=Candidatus Ozemobacter sibiricus TaxID=2268124 RepID=A0A367ZIV1_9BACT|nr:MAG: hypothetical protein OZSIB_1998 [Candidatus Ozemobacter sibiricus]